MRIWHVSCRVAPAALAFVLAVSSRASAGPYGDSLGKCLVEATTAAEKATLVRWMFATMALHPDVQSISAATPEQRTALTKQTAELFQRLLTETCRTQAREAVRYEGASTLQSSFSLLGQVAVRELFANPKVAAGLAELSKYVDEKKLKELAAPAATQ
jgi:hypothetical protein